MAKANGGNDKQKVLILSALGVVLVGVGAFTVMGGGSTAPAPKVATEEVTAGDAAANAADATAAATDQKAGAISDLYPQRDPFDPSSDGTLTASLPTTAPEPVPAPQTAPEPPPVRVANQSVPTGLPPMDPMSGQMEPLPQVGGNPYSQNTGNVATDRPSGPSYRLSGVIAGEKPMAILEGPDGKQKIVKVGDRIGGNRVSAIRNGKVVLEGQGDEVGSTTLTLKEKTNAESGS